MFETLQLVRLVDRPIFVLKRELAAIPLFGRALRRYGVIAVDRSAGAKALRAMLAAGRSALEEERPLVIFPEGTRVRPGSKPPLQPGFAGLYRALRLPVVPIALDSGRLWGRGLLKRPGSVHFHIGKPIEPNLAREAIEAKVHAAINALEP
jgi:1-acyl-sn-glycerol-3-phosphate acyltransferase